MKVHFWVRTTRQGSTVEETIDDLESYLGYMPDEKLEDLDPVDLASELHDAFEDWVREQIEFGYEIVVKKE